MNPCNPLLELRRRRRWYLPNVLDVACLVAGVLCALVFLHGYPAGPWHLLTGLLVLTFFSVSAGCGWLLSRDYEIYEFVGPRYFFWNHMLYHWQRADPKGRLFVFAITGSCTLIFWLIFLTVSLFEFAYIFPYFLGKPVDIFRFR